MTTRRHEDGGSDGDGWPDTATTTTAHQRVHASTMQTKTTRRGWPSHSVMTTTTAGEAEGQR